METFPSDEGEGNDRDAADIACLDGEKMLQRMRLNSILAAADAACYEAKRNGEDGPHIKVVELE